MGQWQRLSWGIPMTCVLSELRKVTRSAVAHQCRFLGAKEVHVIAADMGNPDDRVRLVTATENTLGGLDHLILNHADITLNMWQAKPEDLARLINTMNVNFISFVDLTSRFLPFLKSEGHVAVISSVAGKMPFIGATRYTASKHALHGFYGSWRQDLRHQGAGVSFTLCVLSGVDTDAVRHMIPKGAIGVVTPQDTAVAIIRGTTTRQREIYYGMSAGILVDVNKFFPNLIQDTLANGMANLISD